ncbi:acyl carrier protein [Chondromyces crocatus]|uniref:Acyl carrier protein n=2 Tax=Chondromyces crocatus TaxID=52 RepID=A0A0K1E8L7_CHOCO|nr:acyl carrier protein [Chondromyces crocatus]
MTPSFDDVRRVLHDHLVHEILLRPEPLGPDTDLFEAGFDSLSLTRVLVFVEDRFGLRIPDEEVVVDELSTLERMARFVTVRIEAAAVSAGGRR